MNDKKVFVIFIATLIFSITIVSASVVINEIMYNPPQSLGGTNGEWIEIYNPANDVVNLTGWKIADPSNHTISGDNLLIPSLSYIVIIKTAFFSNFSNYYDVECPIAKAGFALSNSGEEILLINSEGQTEASVIYDDTDGGDGNNNSLQLVDGEWCEGTPTPGNPNSCKGIEECIENWTCSEWGECADEMQERECEDNNDCGTAASKPAVEQNCNETQAPENCDNSTVIIITSAPASAMFGSENEIGVKFNATCYSYDSIKFLVYGSGSRIISDAQGNKITKYSGCENGTELQIAGDETVYDLRIPFFIYPNCDEYYDDGNYSIALRVCRPSWEKYSENIFNIEISGLNSSICTDEAQEFVFEDNETETMDNESVSAEERLLNAPNLDENKKAETTATADAVYKSKSEKIKNSAVYWLLGASIALSIYLIMVKIK